MLKRKDIVQKTDFPFDIASIVLVLTPIELVFDRIPVPFNYLPVQEANNNAEKGNPAIILIMVEIVQHPGQRSLILMNTSKMAVRAQAVAPVLISEYA